MQKIVPLKFSCTLNLKDPNSSRLAAAVPGIEFQSTMAPWFCDSQRLRRLHDSARVAVDVDWCFDVLQGPGIAYCRRSKPSMWHLRGPSRKVLNLEDSIWLGSKWLSSKIDWATMFHALACDYITFGGRRRPRASHAGQGGRRPDQLNHMPLNGDSLHVVTRNYMHVIKSNYTKLHSCNCM